MGASKSKRDRQRPLKQNAAIAGLTAPRAGRHSGPRRGWRDRLPRPYDLLKVQINDEKGQCPFACGDLGIKLLQRSGRDTLGLEVAAESLLYEQDPFIKHTLDETNRTLDLRTKAATAQQ